MGIFSGGNELVYHLDGRTLRASAQKIERKLASMSKNPELKEQILWELARIVEPYVPYKSGLLNSSATVEDGILVYSAIDSSENNNFDYAEIQYDSYGYEHTLDTHPLARDHWIEVAEPGGEHWEELVEKAARILADALSKEA